MVGGHMADELLHTGSSSTSSSCFTQLPCVEQLLHSHRQFLNVGHIKQLLHTVPQHRAVASHRQAVALRGASANVLPCVCSSPPPSHPHYTHRDDTGTITNTNTNTNKNTNTNSKQIPTNTQIWIIQRLHLFVHLRPSHRHYTPPDDTPHYNDCTLQPQI